jgi:hypothetical protein
VRHLGEAVDEGCLRSREGNANNVDWYRCYVKSAVDTVVSDIRWSIIIIDISIVEAKATKSVTVWELV